MKKAASLVDKALEVARKVRSVPKKPVKTKGKKTVPEALDWGPGIPLDKLAYLNDEEMALVQAKRMFKDKRSYKGIPAFPDPGDTAAGDTGEGTSSSGGLNDGGDSGGSTYGGGGGSDSGAGGDGGMGGYGGGDSGGVGGGTGGGSDSGNTSGGVGGGTGGGSDSGNTGAGGTSGGGSDSGAGGTSASSTSGGTTASGTTQTGSTGPTSGSLSQPARTEASSYSAPSATNAPTPPTSYQTYGGYDPTVNAPSTMASEAAMDRIASGSSVIGNTTPQGYTAPKIQDRIAPTSYGTVPTTAVPASQPIGGDIYEGANSPFADPNVSQYDADNPSLAGSVSQYSQYRSPPAPTTSAYTNAQNAMYAAEDAANFGVDGALPRGGGIRTVQDPTPTDYSPTPSEPSQTSVAGVTPAQTQVDNALRIAASATAVPPAAQPAVGLSNFADPYSQAAAETAFANNNALSGVTGYGSLNTPEETAMRQPTSSVTPPNYDGTTNPEVARVIAGEPGPRPVGGNIPPGYGWSGRVINSASMGYPVSPLSESTPAPQVAASDPNRGLGVSPAAPGGVSPASPPVVADTSSSVSAVPASSEEGAADEYAYDPAQDPANYMRPIYPGEEDQPGYMSSDRREQYLSDLGDTRSSERPPAYQPPPKEEKEKPTEEKVKKKKRPPRRRDDKYVYRDYMYTDYEPINAKPDADIAAFNRYNKRAFKRGGKVGDSVDAAIRIAKSKLL